MILVKLFLSLSCVSAAFVSTVSRSLAAEFSRKMNNQNVEELPNFRIPVNLPQMPKMPSFPNLLPIAHCDYLPENTGSNNSSKSGIFRHIKRVHFHWSDFGMMIFSNNYAGIPEAFKSGGVKGNAIMKQHFDSGLFDEMVATGLITYEDMVDCAIELENFFVANMALDRIIAKHRPEILSPEYKSKYGPVNNLHVLISDSSVVDKNWPFAAIVTKYDCKKPIQYDMEEFNFFRKYYLIFEETSNDLWMRRLRKRIVTIEFHNCDL